MDHLSPWPWTNFRLLICQKIDHMNAKDGAWFVFGDAFGVYRHGYSVLLFVLVLFNIAVAVAVAAVL